MNRLLFLAAACALLPISASAQGFLPVGDDDNCLGCPPTMSADLSNEADDITAIGEANYRNAEDDPLGYGFINWLAQVTGGHIPVDPKCPPPDGCAPDDEGPGEGPDEPTEPEDPDGPGGGGETPPGGGGEGSPPGGDAPPSDGGDEEPQASTSSSTVPQSGGSGPSGSVETFDAGGRSAALAVRDWIEPFAEGSVVTTSGLASGARLRLVSKRESSADRGEYVMRFEVIPPGPRARAVPVLVQAIGGKLYARTVTSIPGVRERARPDRPRRRSVRG